MSPPLKITASQLLKIKNLQYNKLIHELSQRKTGLSELDSWKLDFSTTLKQRHEAKDLHITKEELLKLVDWKLKRGKFRPTLKKLVTQNSENDIKSIIDESFTLFLNGSDSVTQTVYVDLVKKSLAILVKLRGIGPATASLILSLLNKITNKSPPFFSDEAAMLVLQSDSKLKYNMKEYIEFIEWFYSINDQFEFINEDLEHGVWCIEMGKSLLGEDYLQSDTNPSSISDTNRKKRYQEEETNSRSQKELQKRRKSNQ